MTKNQLSLSILLSLFVPLCQAEEITKMVAAADSSKGEQIATICQACHSISKGGENKIGPNLYGVVGREIASAKDFQYSAAMSDTKGIWDLPTLNHYLTAPMAMIPGTTMAYPGIKNTDDRADLMAWLRLQSDNPVALPELSADDKSSLAPKGNSIDPDFALLPEDDGREKVFYTCSVCHSIKLVAQQGLSRESWKETLDWMVEDQEMAPLDKESEQEILDYLSKHFGIQSH